MFSAISPWQRFWTAAVVILALINLGFIFAGNLTVTFIIAIAESMCSLCAGACAYLKLRDR